MKVTGIVQAIKKDHKGICLKDPTNPEGKWYSNGFFKGSISANIGDEVELELKENGQYINLMSVKVIKANTQTLNNEFRLNVDAGNCLQRATELVIAGKSTDLVECAKLCATAFKKTLDVLNSREETKERTQENQDINKDGEYE